MADVMLRGDANMAISISTIRIVVVIYMWMLFYPHFDSSLFQTSIQLVTKTEPNIYIYDDLN